MTEYCEISGSPIKPEMDKINESVKRYISETLEARTKQILEGIYGLDVTAKLESLLKENAELIAKCERMADEYGELKAQLELAKCILNIYKDSSCICFDDLGREARECLDKLKSKNQFTPRTWDYVSTRAMDGRTSYRENI